MIKSMATNHRLRKKQARGPFLRALPAASGIGRVKERDKDWKEQSKLSSFVHDMIICTENPHKFPAMARAPLASTGAACLPHQVCATASAFLRRNSSSLGREEEGRRGHNKKEMRLTCAPPFACVPGLPCGPGIILCHSGRLD